jgi:hypothetical protein
VETGLRSETARRRKSWPNKSPKAWGRWPVQSDVIRCDVVYGMERERGNAVYLLLLLSSFLLLLRLVLGSAHRCSIYRWIRRADIQEYKIDTPPFSNLSQHVTVQSRTVSRRQQHTSNSINSINQSISGDQVRTILKIFLNHLPGWLVWLAWIDAEIEK